MKLFEVYRMQYDSPADTSALPTGHNHRGGGIRQLYILGFLADVIFTHTTPQYMTSYAYVV